MKYGGVIKKNVFLQPQKRRGVAQLVARYVRDVEAGSSSLLTPTKKGNPKWIAFFRLEIIDERLEIISLSPL